MGVLNLFNFQKETSPKGIQAPVQAARGPKRMQHTRDKQEDMDMILTFSFGLTVGKCRWLPELKFKDKALD
ncbi:hypothetical protein Y1Q_0022964 [Alligator mississippiensis]|uniref:Uncharacterized protein n=1 Tax=Alligator mississippiensis TaxID=8496 RepID=A0A151P787_ALLMI|nr:hypothetical protein Y1Q_0022964 [Alligator mississippiensis]